MNSTLDDEVESDAGAAYIFSRCLPMEIYYEPDGPICSGLPVEVNYGFTWSDSVNWYLPDGTLLAADTSKLQLFIDEDITLTAEAFKHDNCVYTDEITLNAGLETIIENGFETKILACDENSGDNFGSAVDIDGDWAVIGMPNDGNQFRIWLCC